MSPLTSTVSVTVDGSWPSRRRRRSSTRRADHRRNTTYGDGDVASSRARVDRAQYELDGVVDRERPAEPAQVESSCAAHRGCRLRSRRPRWSSTWRALRAPSSPAASGCSRCRPGRTEQISGSAATSSKLEPRDRAQQLPRLVANGPVRAPGDKRRVDDTQRHRARGAGRADASTSLMSRTRAAKARAVRGPSSSPYSFMPFRSRRLGDHMVELSERGERGDPRARPGHRGSSSPAWSSSAPQQSAAPGRAPRNPGGEHADRSLVDLRIEHRCTQPNSSATRPRCSPTAA